MNDHPTLKMLLSSIFSTNSLSNWSIFEDKNGQVNVRLRFSKHEESSEVEHTVSYRRKSDAQVKRDRDRAIHHRNRPTCDGRITRSRASEHSKDDIVSELPRCSEEFSASESTPLALDSPVSVEMDNYDPNMSQVIHDQSCEDKLSTGAGGTSESDCEDTDTDSNNIQEPVEVIPDTVCRPTAIPNIRNDRKFMKKTYSARVGKLKFKGMEYRCHRCTTSITVAKHVDLIRMYHCDQCKLYICEKCSGLTQKHTKHRDRLKEV